MAQIYCGLVTIFVTYKVYESECCVRQVTFKLQFLFHKIQFSIFHILRIILNTMNNNFGLIYRFDRMTLISYLSIYLLLRYQSMIMVATKPKTDFMLRINTGTVRLIKHGIALCIRNETIEGPPPAS